MSAVRRRGPVTGPPPTVTSPSVGVRSPATASSSEDFPHPLGPFHSLGVAIILLTLVIMLVQFPLTAKQARSMIQMQRVQPEIKKIQAKYKDDKTKQNEELLKFYQENKINPLAGCLPIVITIPIGMAVFRTFSQGLQHHLPKSGSLGTLYADICGSHTSTKACGKAISHHTPAAMRFLGSMHFGRIA